MFLPLVACRWGVVIYVLFEFIEHKLVFNFCEFTYVSITYMMWKYTMCCTPWCWEFHHVHRWVGGQDSVSSGKGSFDWAKSCRRHTTWFGQTLYGINSGKLIHPFKFLTLCHIVNCSYWNLTNWNRVWNFNFCSLHLLKIFFVTCHYSSGMRGLV